MPENDTKKPKKETPDEHPEEKEPKLPFDITKIDPEKIRLAEKMGLPIGKMLEWIVYTESRLDLIIKNMPNPKQIEAAMQTALNNIRTQAPQQNSGQGGQGSGMLERVIFQALSGGGGGSNEMMEKLQLELLTASISNMKTDAANSRAITNAVVTQITGKAIKDAIKT